MDGAPTFTASRLHLGLQSGRETAAGVRLSKSAHSRLSALPRQPKHNAGEHGQLLMQLESIPTRGTSRAAQPCICYGLCCGPSAGKAAGLGPLLQPTVPHPMGRISRQLCKLFCHLHPCGGDPARSRWREAGFGLSKVLHGSHRHAPPRREPSPLLQLPNTSFSGHTHTHTH